MTIQVGDKLPDSTFIVMTPDGPAPMSSADLAAHKTVALFAVPGAYTPTCHAKHLPGFKDLAAALKTKGVDTIACVSVNDIFVLTAWATSQDVGDDILMLADGSGDFTRRVGLDFDGSAYGMGVRSQRYSMILRDGVVTTLNVEDGAAFEVSSAEYLLSQL